MLVAAMVGIVVRFAAVEGAVDQATMRYFVCVVEHGNISRAAEALRVTQPTLTRQVQALEHEFGTALLVRHGRGVLPTEAGRRLYEGVRGIARQIQALREHVAAAADDPTGEVAFGIPPSPRTMLANALLERFCAAYPGIRVRVVEETSSRLRDLVASGELDLCITTSIEPDRGLRSEVLATEPLMLVGPADASLALDTPVPIQRLSGLPLVLTTEPNSLRRIIEGALTRHGLQPHVRVEANTLPFMTDLVRARVGYTVLPSCGVLGAVAAGDLRAAVIRRLRVTWIVAASSGRALSVAARLFRNELFAVAGDKIESGVWRLGTRPVGQLPSGEQRS
jgi:LysR family nitrogen assimilation transcriptional regulator